MAAAAAVMAGIEGALYRNSGTYGSPTWAEITLVKDVTPRRQWETGDASSRETRAMLKAKTMIDVGCTAVVRADPVNTGYQALYDASNSPTSVLDVLVLDAPLTLEGAAGVRFHAVVVETGKPQEANGIIYSTFDLSCGWSSEGYPSAIDVGSGSAISATAF